MAKSIKIGLEFIAMTKPKELPHITNIYRGSIGGSSSPGISINASYI